MQFLSTKSYIFSPPQPFHLFRELIYAVRNKIRYRVRWVSHKYYHKDGNAPASDEIPGCSSNFNLFQSSNYTSNH